MTTRQDTPRQGQRLRIFLGEAEQWQGKPLYQALLDMAQRYHMAGATVLRGIEGFGPEHRLSTERLPDISDNLPLVIEMVDSEAQIERFLPVLDQMVQRGMISVTPLEIVYDGRPS